MMVSAYRLENAPSVIRHYLPVLFISVVGIVLINTTLASGLIDQKQTCDYLEEAANTGDPYSEHAYGHCFATGLGRPQNIKLAEDWYKKAIEDGMVAAKISLASLYLFHFHDEQKKELAVDLLREPIKKGYSKAMFVMGVAFHNGLGLAKDDSEALKYFRDAAVKWHKLGAAACYLVSKDNLYHLDSAELTTDYCLKLLKRNLSALIPQSTQVFLSHATKEEFVQKYILNVK